MNGKKAKALRRAAAAIPEVPDVEYRETNVYDGPQMYVKNGKIAIAEDMHKSTIVLAKHCRRSWYQDMKRGN